jgi:tetratricopeptide (TPR) repeat protein
MKLKYLFIGLSMLTAFAASAQGEDEDRECTRMRFLAGEELKINNYAGAATYYLKGEKICGGFDKANYGRLSGSLINAIVDEKDAARKKAFNDTLAAVYDRAVTAETMGPEVALQRAQTELSTSKPNRVKADELFQKGMAHVGKDLDEGYVSLYYYNLLMAFNESPADKKAGFKKRLIADYFSLSKMASDNKMSANTTTTLNTYLNYVVKSCDDLLPELKGFMGQLPQEKTAKTATVKNFIALLEQKTCEESPQYAMLIDTLIAIEPNIDAFMAKAKLLKSKKKYNDAIGAYKDAKSMTEDTEIQNEIEYSIGEIQLVNLGANSSAFSTFMGVSGAKRGDALKMAAQAVAQNANNCGTSTVERKMNYYYAVDILEKSQAAGGGVSSLISKYKSLYPSDGELFDNGFSKGQAVTLSCWNTSVTIR